MRYCAELVIITNDAVSTATLKTFLENAVSLDVDLEEYGNTEGVNEVFIDWDTLISDDDAYEYVDDDDDDYDSWIDDDDDDDDHDSWVDDDDDDDELVAETDAFMEQLQTEKPAIEGSILRPSDPTERLITQATIVYGAILLVGLVSYMLVTNFN